MTRGRNVESSESQCPICGEPISAKEAQASTSGLVQCEGCLQWVMPETPEGS